MSRRQLQRFRRRHGLHALATDPLGPIQEPVDHPELATFLQDVALMEEKSAVMGQPPAQDGPHAGPSGVMESPTSDGAAWPVDVPEGWRAIVEEERAKPYFRRLATFLEEEEREHEIFPGRPQRLAALDLTPYDRASVLILGQDPYPSPGHAHGLCFSVPPDVAPPPSLRNIFQELDTDLGIEPPASGCLDSWARQGVLLLNAVLTVRSGAPASHRGRGWERFTDVLIRRLAERPDPMVFVLWGKEAQRKRPLVGGSRHTILEAPHPSPLSAWRGFFGSRPFSRTNRALRESGRPEIDWAVR